MIHEAEAKDKIGLARLNTIVKPLTEKFTLDGHLDSVRGVHFINNMSVLVSVSDDCTIKLWDVKMQEGGFSAGKDS